MWRNQQQGGRWGKSSVGKMAPASSGFSLTKDLKHEKLAKGNAERLANEKSFSGSGDSYNKAPYEQTIRNSLPAPNVAGNNLNMLPHKYTNISTGLNTTSLPGTNYNNINSQQSIADAINKLLPIANAGGISLSAANNDQGRNSSGNADKNHLSLAGKSRDFSSGGGISSSQAGSIPDRGLGAMFGKPSNSKLNQQDRMLPSAKEMFGKPSNSQPRQQGVSSGREPEGETPARWNCAKCQYNNFANRVRCNKCGVEKSKGDGSNSKSNDKNKGAPGKVGNWNCAKCEYHNFGHRDKCNKCLAPRGENSASKNTDKQANKQGGKKGDEVLGGNVNVGIGRFLSVVEESKKDGKNGVHEKENDEGLKLVNEWRCTRCQTTNFNKRMTCRKCQGFKADCDGTKGNKNEAPKSKPPDDWRCSKCKNVNYNHRTQCNRCNSNRRDCDGGSVPRDGAAGGRKDGGGLSNEQLSTTLKAIGAIEGMQGQGNNSGPGNGGMERSLSWRDQGQGNNNRRFDNLQQQQNTDGQLPNLVRKIAAEEIANKIIQGSVPIANNPMAAFEDHMSDQVRKFAAEDIATKIIEGRDLGGDVLTHAQEQAIDQMRMMAAEEIANKILQGGGNMNMDLGNMGNMANIQQDINNIVMNPNMMPPVNLVPPVNMLPPGNIMPSGVIQPVIGPNSSVMALVLPPGDNPPMNIIPANSMGMNIIPPGNMMLNSIPGENDRINANDVFNSGAVDSYSNYRKAQAQAQSQGKKKNVQPVKELHPLPPKRMRRKLAREKRAEREAEATKDRDKDTAPVLGGNINLGVGRLLDDTAQKNTTEAPPPKSSSDGPSKPAIGKRAMLWAQGRAQKNLEGVSVKHVIAVKPKEKGKGRADAATKINTNKNNVPLDKFMGGKQIGSTPSTTDAKKNNSTDAKKNETTMKTAVQGKGDVIDLISDSDDDDIIEITDEKNIASADKETDKSTPDDCGMLGLLPQVTCPDEKDVGNTEKEKEKQKENEKEKQKENEKEKEKEKGKETATEKDKGTTKTPVEWTCTKCKVNNFERRVTCRKCSDLRSNCDGSTGAKVLGAKVPEEWRCAKCQANNYKRRMTCRKCQGSRNECDGSLDNQKQVEKNEISNPLLCIDDSDEPMYTVVDRCSDDADDGMYTFSARSPNEPTQKVPSWSDKKDFGMLGLLPQVPRPDKDKEKERPRHNEKPRRRKRKMTEKELKDTLSEMGILKENDPKLKEQIEKRGLKDPHAANNTNKTDVVPAPVK